MTAVDISRLVVFILILVVELFWLRIFVDMVQSEHLSAQERTQWLYMFILLNFIGAAFYYFNEFRRWH